MPSVQPFARLRGPITPERQARLDELRAATRAEIEDYERPIREGIAWPIPPYRAVLTESDETVEIETGIDTRVWSVSVPAVPGAVTHGPDITAATTMAHASTLTCSQVRRNPRHRVATPTDIERSRPRAIQQSTAPLPVP